MDKPRILFYTDCYIFAGCEKPMCELLSSDKFVSKYDHKLIYRRSKEYDSGFGHAYPRFCGEKQGIRLPDPNTWNFFIERKVKNKLLMRMFRRLNRIFFRISFLVVYFIDVFCLWPVFLADRAQIVHINNGGYPGALSCRAAALAAKLAGKKRILFSVHNMALGKKGIADRVIDLFVKKNVDLFITGSIASGAALSDIRGFESGKMTNVYHGIEPLNPALTGQSAEEYESDVLMVAAMEERKGHAYVIHAIRRLIDNDPKFKDLKAYFIGGGMIKGSVEKMISEQRLQDNIKLLGHRRDYAKYLASTKVLLNPSIGYEDLPFVIIEAMSIGVPVIGTDIAGIPEEIENGVNGYIVKPKDVEALAEAMRELLLDGKKRIEMGNEGRRIFSEKFTVDKMVANYMRLYEEMGV